MRKARRRFLLGSALACGWSGQQRSHAAVPQSPTQPDATLRAYVDVLIPADETPSGTALGVDRRLLTGASKRPAYQRLLDLGLDWLNRQARADHGRDFAELGERDREAVVSKAAAADHHTVPRMFFERTRADAFFHYYARRESWRGIAGHRGPPQPLGFMDHTQSPRGSR